MPEPIAPPTQKNSDRLVELLPKKIPSFQESRALMAQVEEPIAEKISLKSEGEPKKDLLADIKAEAARELEAKSQQQADTTHLLTLDNLQQHWAAFAQGVESPTLQLQLKEAVAKLQLVEKTIQFAVGSTLAKSQIENETALIEHLRNELGVPDLLLEIKVERSNEAAISYTPPPTEMLTNDTRLTDPEKLRLMADENNLIRDFFKKFDLKIEPS